MVAENTNQLDFYFLIYGKTKQIKTDRNENRKWNTDKCPFDVLNEKNQKRTNQEVRVLTNTGRNL